jgi:ABC-2 type transport system ATP-binding protein/lipopolysaccharide transport system ATP-binding protein
MYLRLAFSVAAHLEPDIMVVDEVLAVGDAEFQAKCLGRMESAEREGRTILFVSHNLDAITRLCNRALWLERGTVRSMGPASEIVEAYLTSESAPVTEDGLMEDYHGNVALQGVRVLDGSGRMVHVLRRDQSITIEVRFSVRRAVPGLDLAAYVLNSRGVEVLNEAWSDTSDTRESAPGDYVAHLEVPAVLNVGDYVTGVWIGTAYETLVQDTGTRRFRVEGDPKDRLKRSVILDLPWRVARVRVPTPDQPR